MVVVRKELKMKTDLCETILSVLEEIENEETTKKENEMNEYKTIKESIPIMDKILEDNKTNQEKENEMNNENEFNDEKENETIGEIKDECFECGYEIDLKFADEFEGDFYCNDCFNEKFFSCSECGDTNERIDSFCTVKDELICEDCKDESYVYCIHCDSLNHEDDSNNLPSGENVCSDCYDDNYFTCNSCEEINHNDQSISTGYNLICEDCCCNYYFTCDSCNEIFNQDEMLSNDNGCYCNNCNSGLINSYEFKPHWIIQRDDPKERVYGIENEIECERNSNKDDIAEWITDHYEDDFIFLKEDGTIDYGFEIVSHPLSLKYHKERPYRDIFNHLINEECSSHNTKTCGLHIHAEKKGLNNLDLIKIVSFVNLNIENYQMLARRKDGNSYGKWKGIKNGKELKECFYNYDRYEMVNLENHSTIEFRMFRGTLKHSSFIACIELVDATIEFCTKESLGIGFLFNNPKRAWIQFVEFINQKPGRYKELISYMNEMKERKRKQIERRNELRNERRNRINELDEQERNVA